MWRIHGAAPECIIAHSLLWGVHSGSEGGWLTGALGGRVPAGDWQSVIGCFMRLQREFKVLCLNINDKRSSLFLSWTTVTVPFQRGRAFSGRGWRVEPILCCSVDDSCQSCRWEEDWLVAVATLRLYFKTTRRRDKRHRRGNWCRPKNICVRWSSYRCLFVACLVSMELIDRRSRGALLPGKPLFLFGSMTSFSILTRSSSRSSFAVSSSPSLFTPPGRKRKAARGLERGRPTCCNTGTGWDEATSWN